MSERVPLSFHADLPGIRYSLVSAPDNTHLLAVIEPEIEGNTRTQTFSVLKRLDSFLEKYHTRSAVLSLNIFLREIGDKQLVRALMIRYFGNDYPATTYIPQTPCDGPNLVMELYAIVPKTGSFVVEHPEEGTTLATQGETRMVLVGGLIPEERPIGAHARSFNVFERMKQALEQTGFGMADLLRTWIYQGHIVLAEGDTQRYKELNRARSDFFAGTSFLRSLLPREPRGEIYPASTGIGADDVDVVMGAWAIQGRQPAVVATPLENPDQTPAFDYGAVYSPQSPKFSRAMAFAVNGLCTVLVSGTASITDSETRHIGDPEGQVHQTLDNIEALITGHNLTRHALPGYAMTLSNMGVAKVYIKREQDREKIEAVCRKRLSQTPVVYTFADVCRDDLLVEIEGIAFATREDDPCAAHNPS